MVDAGVVRWCWVLVVLLLRNWDRPNIDIIVTKSKHDKEGCRNNAENDDNAISTGCSRDLVECDRVIRN